jgi:hypothetical protein
MNTGIQDSFNLAWKLALVLKGIADKSLLDTFSEERIPVIAEMIAQTTKLLKKTLDDDDHDLQTLGSLFQLGVNYRWSSIVVDERKKIEADREAIEDAYLKEFEFPDDEETEVPENLDSYGEINDGRLRAGDRAPDASGLTIISPPELQKQVCQLFQIYGPARHTVLIFADVVNARDVLNLLAAYPKNLLRPVVIFPPRKIKPVNWDGADFVLEDRDGHATQAYCSAGVCGIIIIRPDGVVGAIVRGAAWAHRYFHGIFSARRSH